MQISDIPFGTTNWSDIDRTEHKGETGMGHTGVLVTLIILEFVWLNIRLIILLIIGVLKDIFYFA